MPTWVRWIWLTLAALGSLWLLWRLAEVVLLLALALVATCALAPVADWLGRHGVGRGTAAAACILALFAVLALFVAVVAPVLVQQAMHLSEGIPSFERRLDWLERVWSSWRNGHGLIPKFSEIYAWLTGQVTAWLQAALGMTGRFVVFVFGAFTVLFLTFFFLRDREALLGEVLLLAPISRRRAAADVLGRIGGRVGSYVLGQIAVMVSTGTLATIGLWAIGLPYAATLGLIVAVLDIVPYFGPIAAALPGIAIGFAISWQHGLAAMAVYALVQQLEGFGLTPMIAGRAVGLHPVWIMLALMTGGALAGVVGMVLAVPAAVTLQILLEELVLPRLAVESLILPEEPPAV